MIIPELLYIDTKSGLSHMAGNTKLYLSVLQDFYHNYIDLNLKNLETKEFRIVIHTLKGLSANIGAYELHKIVIKLEKEEDVSLYKALHTALYNVLGELKYLEYDMKQTVPLLVDELKKERLFESLQQAIKNEIPKECSDICENIEHIQLSTIENELFQSIKRSLSEFDFDDALQKINKL